MIEFYEKVLNVLLWSPKIAEFPDKNIDYGSQCSEFEVFSEGTLLWCYKIIELNEIKQRKLFNSSHSSAVIEMVRAYLETILKTN